MQTKPIRRTAVAAIAASVSVLIACNGGGSRNPTAPSPIATTAPPPVIATPPSPVPSVTNYAGRWSGQYIVEQCSGSSGSMDDVLCSAPRPGNSGGIFQLGVSRPMLLEITQNGTNISGILGIGQTRGSVTGSVRSDGSLFIAGTSTGSEGAVVVTGESHKLEHHPSGLADGRHDVIRRARQRVSG